MATLLSYNIKPDLMDLKLCDMCWYHALLASLLETPFTVLLLFSLPVLQILLHCNTAC